MTFREPENNPGDALPSPAPQQAGLRLPLSKPVITYVLLGIIIVAFILDYALTQLFGERIVFFYGAQWNELVAEGWYWQLFTSIFLHSGLTHLLFNAYALFILGRDIEAFYSPKWFLMIYLLAGLAGSVAWYVLGDPVPSVGASGAIFGLIGAEAAFFVRNRKLFGQFGRQRLANLGVLLAINLVFGFTMPNINNIAHLGGLIGGFLLGYFIAPHFTFGYADGAMFGERKLVDQRTTSQRWLVIAAAVIILIALVLVGNQKWL
jgi:rhomboid protease GluP